MLRFLNSLNFVFKQLVDCFQPVLKQCFLVWTDLYLNLYLSNKLTFFTQSDETIYPHTLTCTITLTCLNLPPHISINQICCKFSLIKILRDEN